MTDSAFNNFGNAKQITVFAYGIKYSVEVVITIFNEY